MIPTNALPPTEAVHGAELQAQLISQLEAVKFTRLVRHMANLPIDRDNLHLPAMAHGFRNTELLVRMFGKVSALSSWATTWVFQPAFVPVGLWTEAAIIALLKKSLSRASQDISGHPSPRSIFYGYDQRLSGVYQYPISTDALYYLASNVAAPLSEKAFEKLAGHFRTKFGDDVAEFGMATPHSMAKTMPEETKAALLDLLNMPSSYYFVARQGRISVVPATEHGWYLVGRSGGPVPATATSRLQVGVCGLADLEALVNSRRTSEGDIQTFLSEHPEFLFALDERYCEVRAHVGLVSPAETALVPDFLVRHEDSSRWDMIELKRPAASIVARRGGGERAAKHAAQAIRQLMEYTDAVSTAQARAALTQAYGASPYEPCLLVLIGRGSPQTQFRWRSGRLSLPDVRLVTYDFLLDRAKRSATMNHQLSLEGSGLAATAALTRSWP